MSWKRMRRTLTGLALLAAVLPGLLPAPAPAVPTPEQAAQDRARAGAWAAPAAAWHHLALADQALRRGNRPDAQANYRLAASLDPDLPGAWAGLVVTALPDNPQLALEGLDGVVHAVARSWEMQRRLAAILVPPVWAAGLVTAALLLTALGTRHLPRRRHVLCEGLRGRIAPPWLGVLASLLAFLPLGVPWGLAAASAFYAGAVWSEMTRREKGLAGLALVSLVAAPALWSHLAPLGSPIDPRGPAWLLERSQRELPSPALESELVSAAAADPTSIAFAQGMVHRRSGRLRDAATAFERAAGGEPPVGALARVNLGNLRFWGGDPTAAAQSYEQVLDCPQARLEARYNLSIALSRLYRFGEAEQQLQEASRLDFDRVLSAGRAGDPGATSDVMDGLLGPGELWAIEDQEGRGAAPIPAWLEGLFPGSRLAAMPWAIPCGMLAGILSGVAFARRLRVHLCQHCGRPVCRRCVRRVGGHGYCPSCATFLEKLPRPEYSRALLRRFLGEETIGGERGRRLASFLLPGFGPLLAGKTVSGAVLAWLFVVGLLVATRAAWAFPPSPALGGLEVVLQVIGALCAAAAASISIGVARASHPKETIRRYFERDVDRAAA